MRPRNGTVELFESGKILWQKRYLVLTALFVSALAGILLTFHVSPTFPPKLHGRTYTTGEASAQVLIDTTRSQIADLNPNGSQYVYERASLLSNLMATAPVQEQLASSLKLLPGALSVTPPTASIIAPIKATGLATDGAVLTQIKPTWNLAIAIDPNLPLLNFTATAPTPVDASNLALAAISVLKDQVGGLAQREDVPAGQQVVVNTIGPPVPTVVPKGFRKVYGAAITLIMFLVFCFLIVILERRRPQPQGERAGSPAMWSGDALAVEVPHRALYVRTFKMRQITSGAAAEPDPDSVGDVASSNHSFETPQGTTSSGPHGGPHGGPPALPLAETPPV
jgi:hypothetical protein